MTRVLVLGATGMLGHKAFQVLGDRFETHGTVRRMDDRLRATGLFPADRIVEGVDALDMPSVARALDAVKPSVVLNCIGIVKQLPEASDLELAMAVNATFPHALYDVCEKRGSRVIHLSTDCVFSGAKGMYRESDEPDAKDLYGQSKLLGELRGANAITLRTSMIGRELFGGHALVEWFLSNRGGRVRGFRNAIFSGLTTVVIAREISRLIDEFPSLSGVYHLAAAPISKFDLLVALREAFGIECEIEPDDDFRCDRSLDGSRYQAATGFVAPSWGEMIGELAADVAVPRVSV